MMNKLQIDLTVEETNLVLEALGGLPFIRVAPLIASIQAQAQEQLQSGGIQVPTPAVANVDEPSNPKS